MPIIGLRVSNKERNSLKATAHQEGFRSISDYLRMKLSLAAGRQSDSTEPVADIEDTSYDEDVRMTLMRVIDLQHQTFRYLRRWATVMKFPNSLDGDDKDWEQEPLDAPIKSAMPEPRRELPAGWQR